MIMPAQNFEKASPSPTNSASTGARPIEKHFTTCYNVIKNFWHIKPILLKNRNNKKSNKLKK